MNIGNKNYGKQKMRVVLKDAPELKKGVTYVPLHFFNDLMKIEVVINNNHV